MTLRHEIVLSLIEILNADKAGSKRLRISHLDDTGTGTATTEELPILITAARNFARDLNNPARFHSLTFYTSAKMFPGGWELCFSIIAQALPWNLLTFYTSMCPKRARQAFPWCISFAGACVYIAMAQGTRKEFERLGLKIIIVRLSERCRRFSQTRIPAQREA